MPKSISVASLPSNPDIWDDSFARTLMIMKDHPTFELIYHYWQTLHKYRGAILFWIYLMAIMAYAYRWVEY